MSGRYRVEDKSDGMALVTHIGTTIPDNVARVYVGKEVSIGLARNFFSYFEELGYVRYKRGDKQNFDHDPIPTNIIITDEEIRILLYRTGFEDAFCRTFNFMVVDIDKDTSKRIKEKFSVTTQIKLCGVQVLPDRMAAVVHLSFSLEDVEELGRKMPDLRGVFGC